jgi:hypothetical protein
MATASPFLALPGELRNRIVQLCFAREPAVAPPSIFRSPLALSLACRQLYNETHTFAFAATTFRTRHWMPVEIRSRLQRVRPALHPHIKSIELNVAVIDFVSRRYSLEGLQFAKAGLSCVEELYIRYTSGTNFAELAPLILQNLGLLIMKTVSSSDNHLLRRICIVHGGLMPWTIVNFYEHMKQREHGQTRIKYDEEQHRFNIMWKEGSKQRDVAISMGRTVREAETYHLVRQQLLKVG